MSWESVLGIAILALAVLCGVISRYLDDNVRLTYTDQKVGVKRNFITKKEKKK